MVMMCQPLYDAVMAVEGKDQEQATRILLTPQGAPLKQELVEQLARRLPLAVIKNLYGIAAPTLPADGILSKTRIAHFYDRTDYARLPQLWKENCEQFGFTATEQAAPT